MLTGGQCVGTKVMPKFTNTCILKPWIKFLRITMSKNVNVRFGCDIIYYMDIPLRSPVTFSVFPSCSS